MDLQTLLEQLHHKDIQLTTQLSVEGEQELKIQAPRGAMSHELQALIKQHKSALIHYFRPLKMKFSLFFFGVEQERQAHETYTLLFDAVKFADAHGFSAVWTPERHFHKLGGPFPNPAVLGAALAPQTQHLQIRAGSVVLPLQDPIRVAEEWAVVDQISQGRVALSFASGWHARDFALSPEASTSYAQRHQIMNERVKTVQRLWRGETIARQDGNGKPCQIKSYPTPYQAELPVWLTALGNPEAFKRTGNAGHNLLTALLDQTIAELKDKVKGYREALTQTGRKAQEKEVAVFMHTFLGRNTQSVKAQVKGPFQEYLKHTLHLLSNLSQSVGLGFDPDDFSPEDQQQVLDFAFERYFEERALMGSLKDAEYRIRQMMDADVQEIACLIDFGLPHAEVMQGLSVLAQLVKQSKQQ